MATHDLARAFTSYVSDDTVTYEIGTTIQNITANGGTDVLPGTHPSYPRGFVPRHVWGISSTGVRAKLPILTPGNALFVSGGSFTKDGVSFTVQGRIGERRIYRGG